jgi:hypothetical protein
LNVWLELGRSFFEFAIYKSARRYEGANDGRKPGQR